MIWIIGEYAERIENADELLQSFLESFSDENPQVMIHHYPHFLTLFQVQLQILTAIVKLFLKRPKDTQEMVQKVLNLSTQETDNPDLRDRGYVYWRLLSTDPEAAKVVDYTQHLIMNLSLWYWVKSRLSVIVPLDWMSHCWMN